MVNVKVPSFDDVVDAGVGARHSNTTAAAADVDHRRDQSKLPRLVWDAFLLVLSVVLILVDVGSDLFLAHRYYVQGRRWWFGLTVAFVVVPSLTVMAISIAWYASEGCRAENRRRWVSRVVFLVLQMDLIYRSVGHVRAFSSG